MTVQIQPEDEWIIAEKLRDGSFRSVDELIHHAIVTLPNRDSAPAISNQDHAKNLVQLFADSPFKGLAMEFERFPDTDL